MHLRRSRFLSKIKEISKGPITRAVPKIPKDIDSSKDNQGQEESTETTRPNEEGPVHPYANIPEVHYAPPATKNFRAPMEKPLRKEIHLHIG